MTSSCRVAVGDASTSPGRWHAVWVRANVIATRGTCSCRAARREAVRPPTLASSWCAAAFMSRDFLCPPSRESFWSSRRRPWDGVWDATSAAAAVRDHDTGVEGDPTEVFAAHLASGGPLRPRRGVAGTHRSARGGAELASEGTLDSNAFVPTSRCLDLCAPRETPRWTTGPSTTRTFSPKRIPRTKRRWFLARRRLRTAREAFGLKPMAPRDPNDAEATRPIARAIARLCGGVSAARLGGVTCRDRRWCRAGLVEASAALARVAAFPKSVSKKSPPTSRAAPQPPPATWRPAWRGPPARRARARRGRGAGTRDRPITRFDRFGIATRRSVRARRGGDDGRRGGRRSPGAGIETLFARTRRCARHAPLRDRARGRAGRGVAPGGVSRARVRLVRPLGRVRVARRVGNGEKRMGKKRPLRRVLRRRRKRVARLRARQARARRESAR